MTNVVSRLFLGDQVKHMVCQFLLNTNSLCLSLKVHCFGPDFYGLEFCLRARMNLLEMIVLPLPMY